MTEEGQTRILSSALNKGAHKAKNQASKHGESKSNQLAELDIREPNTVTLSNSMALIKDLPIKQHIPFVVSVTDYLTRREQRRYLA